MDFKNKVGGFWFERRKVSESQNRHDVTNDADLKDFGLQKSL